MKRKPKTVNVRIAGIIKFIKFYSEYTKNKQYEEIIIKNVKIQNKTYLNNVIQTEEFRKICEYTKDNMEKYYFIIKFMGYTGARISEVIKVDVKSVEIGYMEIISKGSKFRRIYIPANLQKGQESYLNIKIRAVNQGLKKIGKELNIDKKKCIRIRLDIFLQ